MCAIKTVNITDLVQLSNSINLSTEKISRNNSISSEVLQLCQFCKYFRALEENILKVFIYEDTPLDIY